MDSVGAHKTGGTGGSTEGDLPLALDAVPFDPDKHYWIVAAWWVHWKLPQLAREDLPHGVVVRLRGLPIAAGFIYRCGVNLALFEWATIDPNVPIEMRGPALDLLIRSIEGQAKSWGVQRIFSFSSHQKWVVRLRDAGWIETETGCFQMVRVIQ